MIQYQIENTLSVEEFQSVLFSSTLAARRPAEDVQRLEIMLNHADIVITARIGGKIIGVSRAISDFAYCTYLSDLAVDLEYQKQGIGKELIRQTQKAAPKAKLILLSAPAAIDYYPRIGMTKHDQCFLLNDVKDLK